MVREALNLIPPKALNPVPLEVFRKSGSRFLDLFIDLGGVSPDDRVLDVGCGVGRMALPLTGYLSEAGVYEGFDARKNVIQWCEDNITACCPNFRFRHVDIANTKYNPEGRERPETFTFPYENESFDFVFLGSVFTHLLPLTFVRYLGESARVMRPGGRMLATFFLLNDEARELIAAGKSLKHAFPHRFGESWIGRTDIPEAVVGYEEALVTDLYRHVGLQIVPPIHYGRWAGRERYLSMQDIVVATQPA